eukprot:TRINITY_DN19447_c0_g1_i1.p1 TRINITY_DN19447_c0_g1~~TRINITY_DN19447_c0_g1_i1.p1  ORF type:complete len:374 (+),score=34.67 TRINITY_DN19447_c0_g1_i1:117-1238(+)
MSTSISSNRVFSPFNQKKEEYQRVAVVTLPDTPEHHHMNQVGSLCSEIVSSKSDPTTSLSASQLPELFWRYISDSYGEIKVYRALHSSNDYVEGTNFNIDLNEIQICRENGRRVVLGKGGYATVYKGEYLGKTVAIKFLNPAYQGHCSAEDQQQLQNELDAMCKIENPHIVKCYGGQTAAGKRALVMEYMDNKTLKEYINVHVDSPIQLYKIYKFIKAIAKSLVILHPEVVHRDIKPSNVVLNKTGCVKLSDFGFCAFVEQSHVYTSRYRGTYQYVAPEVFSSGKVDWMVDIYALGVTAWELYHRKQPWYGYRDYQVAVKVGEKGERPPIHPQCPQQLANLIKSCWNQDQYERPTAQKIIKYCNQQLKQIQQK